MTSKTTTAKVQVALPKAEGTTASNLVSQEVSLQNAVGARIRITTSSSATIEGTIYTADPITNLLVLCNTPTTTTNTTTTLQISASTLNTPPGQYHIIPISQISNFQLLTLPTSSSSSSTTALPSSFSQLDTTALQARLSRALTQAQAALSRQGPKGTSGTDQALFDALSRTFPTHWADSTMIISDTFAIDKPYSAANVRFMQGTKGVGDLERMRKVVDMERNKVMLRMGKGEIDGRMAVGGGGSGGGGGGGARKGG